MGATVESDNEFFGFMGLVKELVTSNRPLRLRLDLPGGANDDMLLPQRVFGSEMLCGGIEYRILCVSSSASLALKEMIAIPATLEFVTDRGDLRSVCGIVTEASSGDSDGGLASYQLVLRDALSILEKRINTRVFRNMDEVCSFAGWIDPFELTLPPGPRERRDPVVRPLESQFF